MSKIDFKKELKHLFNPGGKEFSILEVPLVQYLMADGHGDPNTAPQYQQAVEALYGLAYKLMFLSKKTLGYDYVVMPLEGLWWAQDMGSFTSQRDKSAWDWTMMIQQPEWITEEMFGEARQQVAKKDLPALPGVRLEIYAEGLSIQIMHTGSYEQEAPTIARMHAFLSEQGYVPNGKHHEIYLGDPRRTPAEKLKTVLRQPIRKA